MNFEKIQELLNKGDIITLCKPNHNNHTPLYIACLEGNLKIVQLLVSIKEIVELCGNIPDNDEELTPLMIACYNGHLEVVELLLSHDLILEGAINKVDFCGCTSLIRACWSGHIEIVRLLLSYDSIASFGTSSASRGTSRENMLSQTARKSGNKPTYDGYTPLHTACHWGHLEIVKILLSYDFILKESSNKSDNTGWTPLYSACNNGHLEIVELLLSKKDILDGSGNKSNDYNWTPLHTACNGGHFRIVKLLLSKIKILREYADSTTDSVICRLNHENDPPSTSIEKLNKNEYRDETPLYIACSKQYHEIIKLLLCYNIAIDSKTLSLDNEFINLYLNNKNIIHQWRRNFNLYENVKLFLLVVGLCDEYFTIKHYNKFFAITIKLPIELQMYISNLVYNINKRFILSSDSEENINYIYTA